jgi:hypothetical protein
MERLILWFRMWGAAGATANARMLSEERLRERWIVDALEARLAVTDPQTAAA